jgi:hypothetical protein
MAGASKPPVIPEPFANDADPLYITTIPDTTGVAGRASYSLGFPPLTMQPVAGGGKPPYGQDVNGILFALSSHDFYVQAGQLFQWDAGVAAAISGYAVGTILGSTDGRTVWFNTTVGNSTNPDDTATAAGWVSLFSSGFQPFAGLTGGILALTVTQAARKVITLSGTLTSNLAVVFPNWVAPAGRWLLINNTTGAFTVTARTAAGTGVNVPQGGPSNPLEVYGDGTNLYPAVSPLAVPISTGPDPLTLAERTNAGYLYATYFNGSNSIDNASIVSVLTDDGDGFFRKNSKANFSSQFALSTFAGQVTSGQVPLAAVIQYAANILASPALTGSPTAPTPAAGNSSTLVATTAFANPASSLATNGYFKLPSGHIVQYGQANPAGGTITVNLPIPFPNSFCAVVASSTGRPTQCNPIISNNSQFTLSNTGGSSYWMAIGF